MYNLWLQKEIVLSVSFLVIYIKFICINANIKQIEIDCTIIQVECSRRGREIDSVSIRGQTSQEKFKPLKAREALPLGLTAIYDKHSLLVHYVELGFVVIANINFTNLYW